MHSPTHFNEFRPVFAVANLRAALEHYDALGFSTRTFPDSEEYGFAERDGIGLHLTAEPASLHLVGTGVAFLYVDSADALSDEWCDPSLPETTHPAELQPYGLREGRHIDLDGNVIRFASLPDGVQH